MIKQLSIIVLILFIACGQKTGDSGVTESSGESNQNPILNPDKRINCFIYHRFGDNRYPSTNVPLEDFKAHLKYLKDAGFKVMSVSDAISYLKDDQPAWKVAVITVDDGFKSFYENGLPLLESYGFPATLFINTETVGGSSYMDWNDLKDARKRGIEIGNHTHSHAFFLNIQEHERYDRFKSEINQCQDLIEKNMGITPKVFAYPYGEFDDRMKEIVRSAGFIAGLAQNSGVIDNDSDLMACPRFPMASGFSDINGFKLKANALPLKVNGTTSEHVLSDNFTPSLNFSIQKNNLRLNEMQCFIQGGACDLSIKEKGPGEYAIIARPDKSIENRRRTLYTLTVQDQENKWYWFSHLWINPGVRE